MYIHIAELTLKAKSKEIEDLLNEFSSLKDVSVHPGGDKAALNDKGEKMCVFADGTICVGESAFFPFCFKTFVIRSNS